MDQQERLLQIKKLLASKKHLKTREIAEMFNISFDTARRDVLHLTKTGQAIRIHGGIMPVNSQQVPNFLTRQHILSPIKQKMAQAGKKFILPGKLYFFTSSTTIEQLSSQIHGINTSILTNSLDNAVALIGDGLPRVSVLGGTIQSNNRFIFSPYSLEELNHYHFNTVFVGAARINEAGFYVVDEADAAITSRAIELSDKVILFAEKYKFTTKNTSPFKIGSLDQIDVLITDTPLAQNYRRWFRPSTQIIHVMEG